MNRLKVKTKSNKYKYELTKNKTLLQQVREKSSEKRQLQIIQILELIVETYKNNDRFNKNVGRTDEKKRY